MLRQGGGAETLADDLRFACTMAWKPDDTSWLLAEFPEIKHMPTPHAPGATTDDIPEIEVFEWLDRPAQRRSDRKPSAAAAAKNSGERLYQRVKRFGSRAPGPRISNGSRRPFSRGSRTAPALSGVKRRRLPCRSSTPMSGSFGSRPVSIPIGPTSSAARRSNNTSRTNGSIARATGWTADRRWPPDSRPSRGDAVARARLTAVVRLREQLGNRPSAYYYQGYPFDRLRRRLGLELVYPAAVDMQELGCASGAWSWMPLTWRPWTTRGWSKRSRRPRACRDDARTGRFASELLKRRPAALASVDLTRGLSPRAAGDGPQRLQSGVELAQGRPVDVGRRNRDHARDLGAEVFVRAGRPDSAMVAYERLITPDAAGAALALDAAEMMLDSGYLDQAQALWRWPVTWRNGTTPPGSSAGRASWSTVSHELSWPPRRGFG